MTTAEALTVAIQHHQAGRLQSAEQLYRQILAAEPEHADAWHLLGFIAYQVGRMEIAIEYIEYAIRLEGHRAEFHHNLGDAYRASGKNVRATACYQRALQLKPDLIESHYNLGLALEEQDRMAEAKTCQQQILWLRPLDPDRPLWRLRMAVLCPAVFQSPEAIDEYRQGLLLAAQGHPALNLAEHLTNLHASNVQPPLNLIYQGRENRSLKEAYAKIFCYDRPADVRRGGVGRPQVGLLVTPSHEGIFLRFWQGIFQRMKPDRFQMVILCPQGGTSRFQAAVREDLVRLLPVPPRIEQAIETIRGARLDVLYHWEVGTDATNYFFPFFRLAPVQCTSLAIQDTSGVAQIDYYLSSALVESEDAQRHYTEKLLSAKTLLTYYPRQTLPTTFKPREAFGLNPRQHVYLCAQNPRKIHPDFDAILAGILGQDAAGIVVLVQDPEGCLAEKLRRRMTATIPEAAQRIVFLPWQKYADYLSLVAAADVLLDPLYYSGGTTSYEALALGKPIVTWPWRLQCGRTVLAFYRKMGIAGCVAGSAEEYVKMAVALGTQSEYREALGREIAAASGELFEDPRAVEEHVEIFERLVEQARSG